MRVLILSDANSIHTVRWVRGLNSLGVTIGLWSINKPDEGLYDDCKGIKIYHSSIKQERFGLISKLKYLSLLNLVKKCILDFKPDLLHAHYASSFGLLGALSGFKPFVLSIWGSDVYDFPNQNILFARILRYNLKKADFLLSTSKAMAKEASKYTNKDFYITPFGIDLRLFKPVPKSEDTIFTVGTIKTLEEKYGIDQLIDAFAIFKNRYPNETLKLVIVGDGSLKIQLQKQANELGLSQACEFVGNVKYDKVPFFHQQLDICICLSNSESFGVSAIEASASMRPVIVSNVGGLPEVVKDNITGIVVPQKDPKRAAEAIEKLFLDHSLRKKMGEEGRKRVEKLYDWDKNLLDMLKIYEKILEDKAV
ncbi:glycosyltransferase [Cecembia calidifontis]|uniref:Glycosyltransferase involved in cell wall biosynthesis n=1 Tax=Cecembia calidifontis TaxID=1187080 RepID=A0A4Q7PAX4_9BACT|nr:glycosyltransferase [Cecembia calidifontis]RZS96700.1 glycosyltransferase involved in cell wall biosynthesis [Cecembia calidifontis]